MFFLETSIKDYLSIYLSITRDAHRLTSVVEYLCVIDICVKLSAYYYYRTFIGPITAHVPETP